MKILGLIPARGGSKGIPNKNIKLINGKPLLCYTAEAALESKKIDKVVLSTDSEKIRKVGISCGLEVPFIRPSILAEDDTPTLPVIDHALEYLNKNQNYIPDIVVLLQPTSPLRKAFHVDNAIDIFLDHKNADSLVSIVQVPHNYNPYSILIRNKKSIVKSFLDFPEKNNSRQKKPIFYARNGAIYITNIDCLINKKSMYGDKIISYLMDYKDSFDIDDEIDFLISEHLIKENNL